MFKNTRIIKILSFNSFSVFLKLLGGFVSIKAIAYFLGPTAMALLGNFKNFIVTTQKVSLLGFTNGIVKYTSEYKEDIDKRNSVFFSSLITTFSLALVISVFVISFSEVLSNYIFQTADYQQVIKVFGIGLPFYVVHINIIYFLNGLKQFRRFLLTSILASSFSIVYSLLLIWKMNIQGALLAIATTESVILVFSIGYLKRLRVRFSKSYFSVPLLKKLFVFSLMALFTAVLEPNVNLYLRKLIINKFGLFEAGIWESVNRFSNYYTLFITSALSLYYLPRLAEINDTSNFRRIVLRYYKFILPVLIVCGVGVFVLRDVLIKLVFGEEFKTMEVYFLPRLVGDGFKILSYALSYQFLAKRMIKMYLISEVLFFAVYVIGSLLLIKQYQVLGVVYAYTIAYIVYWLLVLVFFRKRLQV